MNERDKTEAFWKGMQKAAELARSSPSWMSGGINLSETNFRTFRGTESPPRTSVSSRASKQTPTK